MIERRLVGRQVTTLGTIPAPFRTDTEGPRFVTDGAVMLLDAASPYSYAGSGTSWQDLTGNGNTATLQNSPIYGFDRGGILTFDGVDEYASTSVNVTVTAATFLMWIYRNGAQIDWTGLMFSRSTNVTGFNLRANTLQLGYHWNAEGNTTFNWVSNLTVPDLSWCMIGLTVTSTTATAYLFTANGLTTATNTTTHNSSTINVLEICRDSFVTRVFKGNVQISALYTRALSATEMIQNFQATRGRFNV